MTEKKSVEEVSRKYAEPDTIICSFCKKAVSEEEIVATRNKSLACEECYDPADPDQQETEPNTPAMEELKEINSNYTPPLYFTSGNKNTSEKAVEINAEEENARVEIPPELNIVDCPPDIKEDKEWFRKQFKNFWRLFNNDSEWVFAIHDRGSCKSKNDAIIILYNIAMSAIGEYSFVMRNWEEPTRQTKEYFKKIINEFDRVIWKGEKQLKDVSQWVLLWLSTYKGVSYKKSPKDKAGELRCHFFSLFASDNARTLINQPVKIVVFDECIPTRKQILKGKGWDANEPSDFMELMKSIGRGTKPKKVFTGNPNDSFYSCWFLLQHFKKELEALSKWYWNNRPKTLEKWLKWTWIKEIKKGNKTLQLQKIETSKEDFDNYEEGNWDNFFQKQKDLKIAASFHIYLTARGRGKTDTKAWQFLEEITNDKESNFAWIRRNWHDSLDCSKPYFQQLIYKFCEKTGKRYGDFVIHEKGVFYREERRIYFCDLFSFKRFRGQIARVTFKEIVFEEAIPIDGEFLAISRKTDTKTEPWMFNDLINSLKKRKDKDGKELPFKTKITFLGNPYIWSAWFLDVFAKNLFELKKLAEEKEKKGDNSGVFEKVKDEEGTEWLLYINLIEGEDDPHSKSLQEKVNPFSVNWDDYMISLWNKSGNVKKYQIEFAVQDFFLCELGEREVNKKYFFMHFSKNKKEVDSDVANYCFNLEEKAKSKLVNCVVRGKEKELERWVNMLKSQELFFSDFRARDWFLEQVRTI